jgi:alkylated DNA repair dioxygenase AlkB
MKQHGQIARYSAWVTLEQCTCSYKYAGTSWDASEATPMFAQLVRLITQIVGKPEGYYNGSNCNYYEDGNQFLRMHSDDEQLFSQSDGTASIVSFSFGSTREMTFRHCFSANDTDFSVFLRSKDLLHMDGQTQLHYQHAIPKSATAWRYNVTLRRVVKHSQRCKHFNHQLQGY